MQINEALNVVITDVDILNEPASVIYRVRVGPLAFESKIKYLSISDWDAVKRNFEYVNDFQRLISLIIAWDSMRFLALGGTSIEMPNGFGISAANKVIWKQSFMDQFGEWRYRNNILDCPSNYPDVICNELQITEQNYHFSPTPKSTRSLMTNGGGKDTLAGMAILNEAGIEYDLYEGYLPTGGNHKLQEELLAQLHYIVGSKPIIHRVNICDNFYSRPDCEFEIAGVNAEHFKSDFAVGHTANYIGYFPIIIANNYRNVWFNIEKSSDETTHDWNGEKVNHQWCKSSEYQKLAEMVFKSINAASVFEGFESTLRGLYDHNIYRVIKNSKSNLSVTHSCNIEKPWCRKCPKCLYCYLMTTVTYDEEYAKKILNTNNSLFDDEELLPIWESLLDSKLIAWECVPSHEECLVAIHDLQERGLSNAIIDRFSKFAKMDKSFDVIDKTKIPQNLLKSIEKLLNFGE